MSDVFLWCRCLRSFSGVDDRGLVGTLSFTAERMLARFNKEELEEMARKAKVASQMPLKSHAQEDTCPGLVFPEKEKPLSFLPRTPLRVVGLSPTMRLHPEIHPLPQSSCPTLKGAWRVLGGKGYGTPTWTLPLILRVP